MILIINVIILKCLMNRVTRWVDTNDQLMTMLYGYEWCMHNYSDRVHVLISSRSDSTAAVAATMYSDFIWYLDSVRYITCVLLLRVCRITGYFIEILCVILYNYCSSHLNKYMFYKSFVLCSKHNPWKRIIKYTESCLTSGSYQPNRI